MNFHYEFEVVEGLEFVTKRELQSLLTSDDEITQDGRGRLAISTAKPLPFPSTFCLNTAIAAYRLLTFPVPRPKALLGHQWMTQILSEATAILRTANFTSLSIGAAGDDSSVFQRLHAELADKLGLRVESERGDLHIRIRPSVATKSSWDVLLRLSPRPWATRAWRTHNLPGALNAPVAAAITRLLDIPKNSVVMNAGCGSGTLLIEGAKQHPSVKWLGCDNDQTMLQLSQDHIAQTKLQGISLLTANMRSLPLGTATVDATVSDLPFGQLMGDRDSIKVLYPAWLREVSRTLKPNAPCIVITHAIKWFEECLRLERERLRLSATYPITLNGLHPRIYIIHKL